MKKRREMELEGKERESVRGGYMRKKRDDRGRKRREREEEEREKGRE